MSRMIETITKDTGEQCLRIKHESGLEIYIMEMPGYHSSHALFGTRYGSINTRFRIRGEEDYAEVPEGIAHFLEHKLFENEDCDAFAQYARTGANANAYTSFDRTCYLFSCSRNFKESLEILLNFVQAPYFTPESVAKEQGIIAQEIRMYEDEPGWRVSFNMLRAMYHNHPVKIDIAGTVESIAQIDADLLYRCYNTFYNLHNMVLSVAGNIKADEVLEICDRLLKPCEDQQLEQIFPEEPEEIVTDYTEQKMSVGAPLFNFGFKLRPSSGMDQLRRETSLLTTFQVLFGSTSAFRQEMTEKKLINSEFCVDAPFSGNGYFVMSVSGESRDPKAVRERVLEVLRDAKENGFSKEDFDLLIRGAYGRQIMGLESVEGNASRMINAFMAGVSPFAGVEILASLNYEEALQILREEVDEKKAVLSVIYG